MTRIFCRYFGYGADPLLNTSTLASSTVDRQRTAVYQLRSTESCILDAPPLALEGPPGRRDESRQFCGHFMAVDSLGG